MCIRRETREKARRSLAFSRVSKPHTHITHMLRQCTSIVYLCIFCTCIITNMLDESSTRKFVSLVEQELLTLPEHMFHLYCFVDVCSFVLFLLALLLFTNFDYPFGIFKLLFSRVVYYGCHSNALCPYLCNA